MFPPSKRQGKFHLHSSPVVYSSGFGMVCVETFLSQTEAKIQFPGPGLERVGTGGLSSGY